MSQYKDNFSKIEKKWQKRWADEKVFEAKDLDATREKFYCLLEFPYPSGDGLHVGHIRSHFALDAISRKKRMEGKNVLFPIGWDAFGLPAENYALKVKKHPTVTVGENIKNFISQIKNLGIGFDWSREINTTDPKYYKWTQWMFLQFFKAGLAYKDKFPINWCPECKIGIANEELEKGKCERCGSEVEQREKEQWMLKMTAYADRLVDDLDTVDYLPQIVAQQKNWIGKSEGINIRFPLKDKNDDLKIFTKFPETIFGVTFMVLAPEHPFIEKYKDEIENFEAVVKYKEEARKKTELDRTDLNKNKTGVLLKGLTAINPVNNAEIPLWVGDFVLMNFGTGAVMAVPGHDTRDFEFAKKYQLPIIRVEKDYNGDESEIDDINKVIENGIIINSDFLNDLDAQKEAKKKIKIYLEEKGFGTRITNYRLRDWVFSRQRYWGEPIPLVYCEKCGEWIPVPEDQLPVELPQVESYEPTDTGESPLVNLFEWVNTICSKCGGPAKRETDTMPNWAGSSWYWLRYMDPNNDTTFADIQKMNYWNIVDFYNGGMEHATRHLLYARFWHKALYDQGIVPTLEPFKNRVAHGMILGEGGIKMSKSKGNVVNPDDIVKQYGSDTLRSYEMFIGPYDEAIPWSTNGLIGAHRFLSRVWDWVENVEIVEKTSEDVHRLLHRTIKKVSEDIDALHFNTAVSALMIYHNEVSKAERISEEDLKSFLLLLYPFAPHMTSELWEIKIDQKIPIYTVSWPLFDPEKILEDQIKLVIQINGKVRDEFEIQRETGEEEIKKIVLERERVKHYLAGKEPKKIIYVSGKLVSIVV